MIVEPDFPDHWKTQMLIQISNNEASPMWVIRLWAHCQQRKTHEFLNFPPEALKAVCRFPDHANKLESWLQTSGFIRREDSKVIVHQWDDYNAKLFANWENGKLGGRPKVEPKSKPMDNPPITHGLPNGNPLVTDREELIDEINKKKKKEDISEHRVFTELWTKHFVAFFGIGYKFDGPKDGSAIKALLKVEGFTTEKLVEVAQKAWRMEASKFWCKHARTISGFSSKFNNIFQEVGEVKSNSDPLFEKTIGEF